MRVHKRFHRKIIKDSFSPFFAVRFVQKYYGLKLQTCLLDANNYVYSSHQKSKNSSQWKCINKVSSKCSVRCTTLNNELSSASGEHNHPPTFDPRIMTIIDKIS